MNKKLGLSLNIVLFISLLSCKESLHSIENSFIHKTLKCKTNSPNHHNIKPLSTYVFKLTIQNGVKIIDIRDQSEYTKGHIEGSIFVGDGKKAVPWLNQIIKKETPILLLGDAENAKSIAQDLKDENYTHIQGYLKGGFSTWKKNEQPNAKTKSITAKRLSKETLFNNLNIIDVRSEEEYKDGHLLGASNIPLRLLTKLDLTSLLNKENTYYVHCGSGYQSLIACSILESLNYQVVNIENGFAGILNTDLPLTR